MCWLRILHTLFFLTFNAIYIIYYIIEIHYPDVDVDIMFKVGNASILSLFGVYILDLLQVVIDLGDIFY